MKLKTVFFWTYFQEVEHVGIEAVSRGAKKAILCDNSKQAIDIIRKNIEKTHTKENIELYQTDFEQLLNRKLKEKPDITYIDPPYNTDFAYQSVKLMIENDLIDENSMIIIETDEEKRVAEQLKDMDIEITDTRKYGRAYLIFLSHKRKG